MTAEVRVSVHIDASPETVFGFLIDPDLLCRWIGVEARLDPRTDGPIELDVTGRDVARGRYLEISPPDRVVFTWGWDGNPAIPPASTVVEVTLRPERDGTHVELTHRDLPTEDDRRNHRSGWTHYLDRLAAAAPGGDPGPDPWAATSGTAD